MKTMKSRFGFLVMVIMIPFGLLGLAFMAIATMFEYMGMLTDCMVLSIRDWKSPRIVYRSLVSKK